MKPAAQTRAKKGEPKNSSHCLGGESLGTVRRKDDGWGSENVRKYGKKAKKKTTKP